MAKKEYHLHDGRKGAALAIRVIPRARKNEIAEIMSDGSIKIRLNSPPDERSLNSTLVDFLARVLQISSSKIEVVAGVASRSKLVSILDMDSETAHSQIIKNLT